MEGSFDPFSPNYKGRQSGGVMSIKPKINKINNSPSLIATVYTVTVNGVATIKFSESVYPLDSYAQFNASYLDVKLKKTDKYSNFSLT
jgi:hypothetical protein